MYDGRKLWNEVRQAVLVDGLSDNQACQKFDIHTDTLKKMLAHPEPCGYQMKQPRPQRKIGPYFPIMEEILQGDQTAPPRQRHNGQRFLERLRAEHNYQWSDSTFYKALAALEKSKRSVDVPLKHPPGEAPFDFGFTHAKKLMAFSPKSLAWNFRFRTARCVICKCFPSNARRVFRKG